MNPFDEIADFFVEAFLEYHEKIWKKERLDQIAKEDESVVSNDSKAA